MANLTIKKLPDRLYGQLKKYARRQSRSLNAHVIHILQTDVSEREKFEKMRQSNIDLDRLIASLRPMNDRTSLIREDRDRDC
jgi:plasmid stability protein